MKNSIGRLPRFLQLRTHAAAGVKHETDRNGRIVGRKIGDFLFDFIFVETEVLSFEPGHKAVQRIRHGDVDQDEGFIDAKIGDGRD